MIESIGNMTAAGNGDREELRRKVLQRQASLTECEAAFLSMLLVDDRGPECAETTEFEEELSSPKNEHLRHAAKVLDDDILFSLPFQGDKEKLLVPPKLQRPQSNFVRLWRAHEHGAAHKALLERISSTATEQKKKEARLEADKKEKEASSIQVEQQKEDLKKEESEVKGEETETTGEDEEDAISIRSDEEVRVVKNEADRGDDDASSASSWDMDEGGFDHYDAWAVMNDEYARDFGFDYSEKNRTRINSEIQAGDTFKIIGTSVDDASAQPHVLSPPLMESLLSFVPESLATENFWLKFSLVRDGASLATLKQYCRAATQTILAIETTKGQVFGSFTSAPWRSNLGYFGSGDSFLWRMRHNRMTPCHSLFEQAQMETEIDIYYYSGINKYIQLCDRNMIAVGGGGLDTSGEEEHGQVSAIPGINVDLDEGENYGFGLAINEDLLLGTSSPCATFRSPCLLSHSSQGEVFEIVNLEVWTFTPCSNKDEAEKLEMTKFFVHENIRSATSSSRDSQHSATFSSHDLLQEDFYRRVGEHDGSEVNRERWQYAMMMNGSPRSGMSGVSPRSIS